MPVRENTSQSDQQVIMVTFKLGSQMYALPLAPVRQIIEMVTITPLPQVNHMISGVINFHGALVPVINMRRLLGMEEAPLYLHTPIILVHVSERLIGLIVDKVLDVVEKPINQVVDPNHILLEEMGKAPLLQGLIRAQDGSILLLDLEHMFKMSQTRALSAAIDILSHDMDEMVTDGTEVQPDALSPAQNVEKDVQEETEAQPGKSSKSRPKKTAVKAKTSKEVSK